MRKLAKRAIAIGLASTLAVAAVAGTAWGYFTDQVEGRGEASVAFGYDYRVDEDIDEETGEKTVKIQNTGQTEIMARVLIFGAGDDDMLHRTEISHEGWTPQPSAGEGGTCLVYDKPLLPGEDTLPVHVSLTNVPEEDPGEFRVIVVGQASIVTYDDDGIPHAYTWKNMDQGM